MSSLLTYRYALFLAVFVSIFSTLYIAARELEGLALAYKPL